MSKRDRLLKSIESLIALASSDHPQEGFAAIEKAQQLMYRYEVDPRDLTADAQLELAAIGAARHLTSLATWTRRASDVGGRRDRWQVTGLGEVDARALIQHAAKRGWQSPLQEVAA